MIDVEAALVDLAEHLDHPVAIDLDEVVRRRVAGSPVDARRRPRPRAFVAVAAAVVLVAAGAVLAIAPARHAVADWLGIGAVEIRSSGRLPAGSGAATVPGAPGSAPAVTDVARELAAARAVARFPITMPREEAAGALLSVTTDPRVRDGLVVLRYPRFTIVEIASDRDNPILGKIIDPGARIEAVTVDGRAGMWIRGAHEVGYLDRSGDFRRDTVRRSGPVLLWVRGAVTYRIEGVGKLADARALARSLR